MVLARLKAGGAYTAPATTALPVALILLSAFLFLDSTVWHILPLPWHKDYAHLLYDNESTLHASLNPASHLDLNSSSFNYTVNGANHPIATPNVTGSPFGNETNSHEFAATSLNTTEEESNSSSPIIPLPPEILSLRRLEAGLSFVRSSMRKAVLVEKNGTRVLRDHPDQSQEYIPWGPIYRDPSIFHQSYVEMERRFKVFIYPEGEQPLVHNGPCKEIYSTEGRFIQELQHKNPFVTRDPYKAHVFFLPFSVSMMVSYLYQPNSRDMSPLLHFVKDYVEVVGAKYPFWNRSNGADHFMLSCHDWGPYVSKANPHLEKRAIRVLCNANSSEGFVPHRDASLPEINLVGGHIPAVLGGPPMKERQFLAFFAGRDHGPVRPVLYKYWEGKDDDIKVFHNLPPHSKYTYQDYMKRSKFCLCPGGYEVNSPRIVEAIYNDCIPVIIADGFVLPFSDVLNWDAFSIRVVEKDIPNLQSILQAVSESKREEMQERVRQVKRHFLLNQPPQSYDLFHMILHTVWLRRLNFHLDYHN
ncbi:hypothetical protein GOP47_0007189 [Adiantum capillus-veneris]|uniref:Exostosin GT47 domain-containing protein n=1 Tax=Adiantum capillus-veneris TaxID=13818 RepID=A0A9D4ZLN5_ADICA|nr:hypothetical protein GOP47_0007189 [Adiantum capillus-veneris]